MVRTHGFFGEHRELFGHLHLPGSGAPRLGVVICPPLGYARMQTYRTLRVLADELAARGIVALRLHYHGTGEALSDDFDGSRVAPWLESIRHAAGQLREAGCETVVLAGLRSGALLAGAAAASADAVVLWEPVASGAAYLREMEILATASHGGAEVAPLTDADLQEAAGYVFTPETRADLKKVNLAKIEWTEGQSVLLLKRDDRRTNARLAKQLTSAGAVVDEQTHAGFKELMVLPRHAKVPHEAVEKIVAWIEAKGAASGEGEADEAMRERLLAVLEPSTTSEGLTHRVQQLGPSGRLFAISSEPEDGPRSGLPVVVFVPGGVVPRTAVNRMYVDMARQLAAHGHRVVRLDVSGIGESEPAKGEPVDTAYTPVLVPDLVDVVQAEGSAGGAALVGLCSGAYASFQAALRVPSVSSLVMLNPIVLHLPEGETIDLEGLETRTVAASTGTAGASNKARLKRLLSGELSPARVIQVLGNRAERVAAPLVSKLREITGRKAPGLPTELSELASRGVGMHLIYSQDDGGYAPIMKEAGAEIEGMASSGEMRFDLIEGADHVFSSHRRRQRVVELVVENLLA